jgi:hypothetical protein
VVAAQSRLFTSPSAKDMNKCSYDSTPQYTLTAYTREHFPFTFYITLVGCDWYKTDMYENRTGTSLNGATIWKT